MAAVATEEATVVWVDVVVATDAAVAQVAVLKVEVGMEMGDVVMVGETEAVMAAE